MFSPPTASTVTTERGKLRKVPIKTISDKHNKDTEIPNLPTEIEQTDENRASFMMKMDTITISILIFIRPMGNHTMINTPKNILIHTKMTILMMIPKTEKNP